MLRTLSFLGLLLKNQSSKQFVSLPQASFRGETPIKPRKKRVKRHNGRRTTEVGQASGEVKVMHVLNSLHESREDLVLITVNFPFHEVMDEEKYKPHQQ